MLPRARRQRARLESGTELRDSGRYAIRAESDEPLSPEDETRRLAYSEWLARFGSRKPAA